MKSEVETIETRYERLRLLYQVSNVIHSTLDQNRALDLIVTEAVRIMRASSGSVVLINPTTGFMEIQAEVGLPPNAPQIRLKVGEGITGWVARHGRPANVGNVADDPRYIELRPSIQSELAVPLVVMDELRGVLNVDSQEPNAFSVQDQGLLEELAKQAARVIHNTWLYEQLRLKARLFESVVSVGQSVNSSLDLNETLSVIAREAAELMECKMCSVLLLDDSMESLETLASHGASSSYLQRPRLSVQESLVGTVIRRQKPLRIENVQIADHYQNVAMAREQGLVSLLSVPLTFRLEPLGVINVYKDRPHNFSNEEIQILTALAHLSSTAIQKARLYQRVVEAEDRLRENEQLSALGLLAGEVAHEIRNPLTVLKMLFHSLDLQFPIDDPKHHDVQVIEEKMNHLNRIVEQVLDFARRSEPVMEPVNLNDILEQLHLLTRHKLSQQGIQLVFKPAKNLPLANADAAQLSQAFLNLTLNAIEAMPQGGTLTIRTGTVKPSSQSAGQRRIRVDFIDTGQGMSKDQQERLFASPLTTTKPRGTGLGLAIVARIIEGHQGALKVRSKLGEGTRFTIHLPQVP